LAALKKQKMLKRKSQNKQASTEANSGAQSTTASQYELDQSDVDTQGLFSEAL
jgi:hypothetical protein